MRDIELLSTWLPANSVWIVNAEHEDWCPSVGTQSALDCLCSPTYSVET